MTAEEVTPPVPEALVMTTVVLQTDNPPKCFGMVMPSHEGILLQTEDGNFGLMGSREDLQTMINGLQHALDTAEISKAILAKVFPRG